MPKPFCHLYHYSLKPTWKESLGAGLQEFLFGGCARSCGRQKNFQISWVKIIQGFGEILRLLYTSYRLCDKIRVPEEFNKTIPRKLEGKY